MKANRIGRGLKHKAIASGRKILSFENVEIKGKDEVVLVKVERVTKEQVILGFVAERNPRTGLAFGTPVRAMFLKDEDDRPTLIGKQHKANRERAVRNELAEMIKAAIEENSGKNLLRPSVKLTGLA